MADGVKKCSKCKREFPATNEHFYNQKATSDKLTSWCRRCDRDASREKKRIRRQLGIKQKTSPEKSREYSREWRSRNLDKAREGARIAQKKRMLSGSYRASSSISRRIREVIKHEFKGGFRHLPYTPDELKTHLERQFANGMAWENYGVFWHIDHIRPMSSFEFESPKCQAFLECWSLTNLRPLEAVKNLSKGNKVLYLI